MNYFGIGFGIPVSMIQLTPDISRIRAQGYKIFFMLNSIEHKILIACKFENIKKFSIFQAQMSLECYFSYA